MAVMTLAGLMVMLLGCSSNSVGTGRTVEETRTLSPFSTVVISGPMTVFLHSAAVHKVVVTTDDNVLSHIITKVSNDSLVVGVDIAAPLFSTMTLHIYSPNITSLESSGTGSVSVPDSLVGNIITIVNRATADFWIHRVTASHVDAAVHSLGDVFFDESRTPTLGLLMTGQGSFHAYTLKTDTTTVNIAGSGNAELFVNHLLKGTHSGSGQIKYLGNPEVQIDVTGAGGIGGR